MYRKNGQYALECSKKCCRDNHSARFELESSRLFVVDFARNPTTPGSPTTNTLSPAPSPESLTTNARSLATSTTVSVKKSFFNSRVRSLLISCAMWMRHCQKFEAHWTPYYDWSLLCQAYYVSCVTREGRAVFNQILRL